MKRLGFVLLLLLCPSLYAQTWSGVLAPSRAVDWSNAGVVGGIPNRTNICSTLTSSATSGQINAAIASCSSAGGGVVVLPPGCCPNATNGFAFNGNSNVTVRGAGANLTTFATTGSSGGSGAASASIHINAGSGNSGPRPANLTSWSAPPFPAGVNYPQGTNTITLAAVANLKVGNPIVLDQLDDTSDVGGVFVNQSTSTLPFTAPGSAGPYSTQGAGQNIVRGSCHGNNTCYGQEQVVTVTQCDGNSTVGHICSSGANITISPGLEMPNWNSSRSLGAWWASSPALNDGVEDLSVDNLSCSGCDGIEFYNAQNSWMKGVASLNSSGEGHVHIAYSNHISVVNSYLFLAVNAAPASYGVECGSCSDSLVENNITHAVTTPLIPNGPATGTVFGFNYTVNEYYVSSTNYNIPARGDHADGIAMTLSEGNITNGHTADDVHGNANLMTDFRNYFTGTQAACYASGSSYATSTYGACTQNIYPEGIWAYHRFFNVIGNVLGTTGANTIYTTTSWTEGGGPYASIGYQAGANGLSSSDPPTGATLMLWGNADAATGFGSPRFNCSEVPTSLAGVQAPFSIPCPFSQTLPASFYYTSTPSWWPSGKPWPPIGPDVASGNILSCTSGTYNGSLVTSASACAGGSSSQVAGGHANSIPAMDCYLSLGGLPDGTGPALTNFNEASCYSQTVVTKPQPPTNLTATVS